MFKRKDLMCYYFIQSLFVVVLTLAASVDAKPKLKFGMPSNLGSVVNSSYNEGEFCVSPDGLELYFGSNRPGTQGDWDTWVAKRATPSDPWGWPVSLGYPLNTSSGEGSPFVSADGLSLYFTSNRPGGQGNYDIWLATRATIQSPWGVPVNLGTEVNTWADEGTPVLSPDGLELYFAEYTVYHPSGYGGGDIWVVKRESVSEPWGEVENLGPVINSAFLDTVSSISPDGLSLYFSSTRAGGYGLDDVYVTTRSTITAPWGTPINMGPSVNSTDQDARAMFSGDGSVLYYLCPRSNHGDYDIWQVPVSVVSTCDLDENGVVDLRDFAAFAEDWLVGADPFVDTWPFPWPPGEPFRVDDGGF